jgi:hypothetical protein
MWASLEQESPASDFLELDLGEPLVVNILEFDVLKVPVDITVTYDTADALPKRSFAPVFRWREYEDSFPRHITYETPDAPPWQHFKMLFKTPKQTNVTTRIVRIEFARQPVTPFTGSPFFDPITLDPLAFSVAVKNLKIGRVGQPFSAGFPTPRIDPLTGQVVDD